MAEQKYTISDIIETYISGDWGNDEPTEDASCPVSCIRGADIVPIYNSEYTNIPLRYISEKSLASRALQEGDIVIEKSGGSPTQSTGRVVYISKELLEEKQNIVCSNFCAAFRIKPEWDAKYVYYYLQHIYNAGVFFNFEGKTSGLKNLIMDTAFKSITIKKIAIETQRSIATVLSTIESKMAANRAINHYLEATAKQLYDYWFVQFDFPDKNGNPYRSSGGKMVWNEKLKREIPEKWDVNRLSDFISLYDYKRVPLSGKDRACRQGKYPYYGATGIMDYIDDYIFDGDYILLAEDGSTSDEKGLPIVQYIWGKTWVNNHAHIIRPKDESHMLFSFYLLKGIPAKNIETGSIQKKISQENLLGYNVSIPSKRLIDNYCGLMYPLWEERKAIIEEINLLLAQRDELLPLLMTGQVSVTQLNNDLAND